ncbi:unnamed protein product [Dibothriocephalus latus]|uniref:N(6)-L-threonylcarbamoyladenine synthase n=1 Tax=Dibothriocephalus latus TaxID=60516 RepID=A0A3P6QLJ3_DIBLA|nr:unnamed protein product [Dibothriocephalus latus]
MPPIASQLHAGHIHGVVDTALQKSGLSWNHLSAVAVTVKPGMPFSLKVGVQFAKKLARTHGLPVIPIHHMEAHALTAMLTDESLHFPFLVLLVSGGHSLLALVRGLEDFLLLGTSRDISPGECLDKVTNMIPKRSSNMLTVFSSVTTNYGRISRKTCWSTGRLFARSRGILEVF